jgi:cell division septal protein FtsQ
VKALSRRRNLPTRPARLRRIFDPTGRWHFLAAWLIIAGVIVYGGFSVYESHKESHRMRVLSIQETGPLSAEEALDLLCSNIEQSALSGDDDKARKTYELACLRGGRIVTLPQ